MSENSESVFSFFRETVVYDVMGSSIMMLIVVFNVCYECSMLDQPRETTLFKVFLHGNAPTSMTSVFEHCDAKSMEYIFLL